MEQGWTDYNCVKGEFPTVLSGQESVGGVSRERNENDLFHKSNFKCIGAK